MKERDRNKRGQIDFYKESCLGQTGEASDLKSQTLKLKALTYIAERYIGLKKMLYGKVCLQHEKWIDYQHCNNSNTEQHAPNIFASTTFSSVQAVQVLHLHLHVTVYKRQAAHQSISIIITTI